MDGVNSGTPRSFKVAFRRLVTFLEASHLRGQGGTWGRGFGEGLVEVAPEREACDAFGAA